MTPPQKLVTLRVDSAEPNDRGQVRLDWTDAVRGGCVSLVPADLVVDIRDDEPPAEVGPDFDEQDPADVGWEDDAPTDPTPTPPAAPVQHRYSTYASSLGADAPCRFCGQGSGAMVHAELVPAPERADPDTAGMVAELNDPGTTPSSACTRWGQCLALLDDARNERDRWRAYQDVAQEIERELDTMRFRAERVEAERDDLRMLLDVEKAIHNTMAKIVSRAEAQVAAMQPVVDAARYLVDLWRGVNPRGLLSQGELARRVDAYREGLRQADHQDREFRY